MSRRAVYVVCAEGEESLARQLAEPLERAGYEVAHNGTIAIGQSLIAEAEKAITSGSPIILCATARAVGSFWAHRIVNAAHGGGPIRVFVVQMERQAYVEQLALDGKIARYCDDPAQATQELLKALTQHFPPIQPARGDGHDPVPSAPYVQFLDQLTELTDFDIEAFGKFRSELRAEISARYPRSVTAWEFLSSESLWAEGRLTRTGALLFARNPTAACPASMVKCVQYRGTDRTAFREIATFDGTVPDQIISARQFIADRVRSGETPSADQAQLATAYDYPMVAVREVIANALVHRDYSIADSCVHVRLFVDRLEVSSPGPWVGLDLSSDTQYDLSSLEGQSRKRNYRLAHLLSFIKLVEGEGSGIPAALRSCESAKSPVPTVVQQDGFITVTLHRREFRDGLADIPSFAEQLKLLRHGARLTYQELAEAADVPARNLIDLEQAVTLAPPAGTVPRLADALQLEGRTRANFEAAGHQHARSRGPGPDLGAVLRTLPHRPWSRGQVRVADSWPPRHGDPVSVALSPAADRLALSVGQQLSVSVVSNSSRSEPLLQLPCALAPALTWSPDGERLAFRDDDGMGRLLDLSAPVPASGAQFRLRPLGMTSATAFAPDGGRLAVLSPSLPDLMTLTLLGPRQEVLWECGLVRNRAASDRSEGVNLAWSPDGRFLACTTGMASVWLIDAADGHQVAQFDHHSLTVTGLDWIDNDWIISASEDATMQLWRPDGAAPPTVVEMIQAAGMAVVREQATALIWSAGGELFAWSLADPPAQLWHREPPPRSVAAPLTRLAVSAVDGLLALVDPGATDLVLVSDWDRSVSVPAATTTYANAKVLVLGDSGVGKSALAMVLAGEEFRATESTHGRRIWRVPASEDPDAAGGDREVLIWDLAGQPGYRIVHQLHLGGAALALVVFDSRSETEPLAGVRHWARAVRHAHPVTAGGLTTFLVAARTDRGGVAASPQRIRQIMADFVLDEYFETSAKEGTGTDWLRTQLLAAIDWDQISRVSSTALFAVVKRFIVDQRSAGHLLIPLDELCRSFQASVPGGAELLNAGEERQEQAGPTAEETAVPGLTAVFEGCVARLESAGLVKRLEFCDYVLLQPELLDAYASAIVNAARDEPDGLGSILETKVIDLDFPVPSAERVPVERQERLLVLATLEELMRHELVLRESTEDGVQLIFPSAYRRDLPASEAPRGDGVVFRFEGPVANVYATLIVRLTRSNRFRRIATWQSAARFAADVGECTVFLKSGGEGTAELWVGYEGVPDLLQIQFERFVHVHLDRRAMPGTVTRERRYSCPRDGTAFSSQQVQQVRNLGRESIRCPVCESRISLRDDYELVSGGDHATAAMDASADAGRQVAAASTVLRGKEEAAEFDVFLCHNGDDKLAVRGLAQKLRDRGLRPWLDEHELRSGLSWQRALEDQIQSISAAAVVVGSRVGPWQDQELAAFLRQFAQRRCPVIPVLLPGVEAPDLPAFLDGMPWVDLGGTEPDPLNQLIRGVTGGRAGQIDGMSEIESGDSGAGAAG